MIEFIVGLVTGLILNSHSEPVKLDDDQYNKDICAKNGCIYASSNAPRCPWHHPFGEYYKKKK